MTMPTKKNPSRLRKLGRAVGELSFFSYCVDVTVSALGGSMLIFAADLGGCLLVYSAAALYARYLDRDLARIKAETAQLGEQAAASEAEITRLNAETAAINAETERLQHRHEQ